MRCGKAQCRFDSCRTRLYLVIPTHFLTLKEADPGNTNMPIDFDKWWIAVEEEVLERVENIRQLPIYARFCAVRDEAIQGKYQTDYGQVEIANSELSNLICYACLENWLVGLSRDEGRAANAKRHYENYSQAMKLIYSDKFTAEEQDQAYRVLD